MGPCHFLPYVVTSQPLSSMVTVCQPRNPSNYILQNKRPGLTGRCIAKHKGRIFFCINCKDDTLSITSSSISRFKINIPPGDTKETESKVLRKYVCFAVDCGYFIR